MAINAPSWGTDFFFIFASDIMQSVQNNFGGDDKGIVYNQLATPVNPTGFFRYGEEQMKGVPAACPSMTWLHGNSVFKADQAIKPGNYPTVNGQIAWFSGTVGSLDTEFNVKIIGVDDSQVLAYYSYLCGVLRPMQTWTLPPIISSRIPISPDITEWFDTGNLAKNGKRGCMVTFRAPVIIPIPPQNAFIATILTASVTASIVSSTLDPAVTSGNSFYYTETSGSVFG